MKYISIKILANGRIPPIGIINPNSVNHFFSGIGLGREEILHGGLVNPFQFFPKIVPSKVKGKSINDHISTSTIIVLNGIEDNERLPIAIKFNKNPNPKITTGKNAAVKAMVFIQFLPPLVA